MSVFDTIVAAESGGRNIPSTAGTTSSGTAEGYYQITPGTWNDFAPKAGISLAQYPTPMTADLATQTQVASVIPLARWAPSTVAAVQSQYGTIDTSQTIGQINTNVGGGPLATSTGTGALSGGYIAPDGSYVPAQATPGVTPDANAPPLVGATSSSTAAQLGGMPGVLLDSPFSLGITTGLSGAINSWITGAETAVGTAFKNAMSGVLGTLGNYAVRFFLIVVGVVILAIGLWALVPQQTKQNMARAAASAA